MSCDATAPGNDEMRESAEFHAMFIMSLLVAMSHELHLQRTLHPEIHGSIGSIDWMNYDEILCRSLCVYTV